MKVERLPLSKLTTLGVGGPAEVWTVETPEDLARATEAPYRFPPDTVVLADYARVEQLGDALAGHDAVPVAVGSGSLNDIVKRMPRGWESLIPW